MYITHSQQSHGNWLVARHAFAFTTRDTRPERTLLVHTAVVQPYPNA